VNWVLDYFRRSADHRLLVLAGRVSYSGSIQSITARATRARMVRYFPNWPTVIDYSWGGLRRHHHEPRA